MQKYAQNMQQYAVPNLQEICANMQIRNMQYMCITSLNMLKCAKQKYAHYQLIYANIPYA